MPDKPTAKNDAQVKKAVSTPNKLDQIVTGDLTWQQFYGLSRGELLQMAKIGFTMYEQGQYPKAKAIFEGLRSLDKKESYYSTALGAIHLAEGDLEKAIEATSQAIQVNSRDLAAFVNRGEAYLRMARPVEAAQDFATALKLDPEGREPQTRRARALAAATLKSVGTTAEELGFVTNPGTMPAQRPAGLSGATQRPAQLSGSQARPGAPAAKPGAPVARPGVKPVVKR